MWIADMSPRTSWAKRSRLEPMKAVARTVEKHADGILASGRLAEQLARGLDFWSTILAVVIFAVIQLIMTCAPL